MRTLSLDKESARHMQQRMLAAFEVLFAVVEVVKPHLPDEVFHTFAREQCGAIMDLDLEVLGPIYRAHPELSQNDPAYPPVHPTPGEVGSEPPAHHVPHGEADVEMSPTLLGLGRFARTARSSDGTLPSPEMAQEIASYLSYLGVEPPGDIPSHSIGSLVEMVRAELEAQNRYLTAIARHGYAEAEPRYTRSVFVREIIRLNTEVEPVGRVSPEAGPDR